MKKPKQISVNKNQIVLIILTLLLAAAAFLYFALDVSPFQLGRTGNPKPDSPYGASCNTTENLEFCIDGPDEIAPTDSLTIPAMITNKGTEAYTVTFSSTCTDPALIVNGQTISEPMVCGQALTDVTIRPSDSKTYKIAVAMQYLKEGVNTISLEWDNLRSGEIQVRLKPAVAADAAKYKECFVTQDRLPQCVRLIVAVQDGLHSEDTTCTELEPVVRPLGLQVQTDTCSLARVGLITVSIPNNEVAKWTDELGKLPEVERVSTEQSYNPL